MRRRRAARLAGFALACTAGALLAPTAASADGCPSEQSVLPYSGNNPPYQCAQVHKSDKKSLSPWETKSWTKTISFGYPVEYHCTHKNGDEVTISEAYTTSSYTATATNWHTSKTKKFAAGVLFTTGKVNSGGYKKGCGHYGEIENSIQRIVSMKLSASATTVKVGDTVTFTASVSPSSAPGGVGLQVNGATVAQGALSNGSATMSWTPTTAGTYSVMAGYGGNTSSCPSTASTCGYTASQSNKISIVVEAPEETGTKTTTTQTTTTEQSGSGSSGSGSTPEDSSGSGGEPSSGGTTTTPTASAAAFLRAPSLQPIGIAAQSTTIPRDDFGLVTREKTRKLPARLALTCPRRSVLMNAETLTESPIGRVSVSERRKGATVNATKATRGHRVTLQITCRRAALPRLATSRLGYGTPRADRMTTAHSSGTLFGGPGRDRLVVNKDKGVANGGLGRDVIRVAAAHGVANGGPGDDRLVATRKSRALLVGGPGHDTLIAADGRTFINAKDGERDRVVCASAENRVLVDRKDVVTGPCRPVRRAS